MKQVEQNPERNKKNSGNQMPQNMNTTRSHNEIILPVSIVQQSKNEDQKHDAPSSSPQNQSNKNQKLQPQPLDKNPFDISRYRELIMKQIIMKKGDKDKVTNQTKHYFREFEKQFQLQNEGLLNEEEVTTIKQILPSFVHQIRRRKKLPLKNLVKLLRGGNKVDYNLGRKNRNIMCKILKKDKCLNSSQKNRLRHKIASKVYAIRCRNEILVTRNSI